MEETDSYIPKKRAGIGVTVFGLFFLDATKKNSFSPPLTVNTVLLAYLEPIYVFKFR